MDVPFSVGLVEDPSDPEELAISDSDSSSSSSSSSHSSVDTDPGNGLEIVCDLIEKFDQDIGPWLFEVLTCAFRYGEEEVASVHSYLIKRESIQARDNQKKSLRKAMKEEDHMLNVMFELPKILHPHGHVNPDFLTPLSFCFGADDIRAFPNTTDAAQHPTNRAWILLIRDIVVDEEYRRLGIGGNMIRKTIQKVLSQCTLAGRPLLVAVQPKRIDEFADEEWSEISEMIYHCRVNERFWENIGFKRYQGSFSGFTAPWHFWGTAFSLPPKKRILIPENLANRNTRTATPPPRPPNSRDSSQATPYDWFPVVEGNRVRSFIDHANQKLPTLVPAPPRDDCAPGHDDATDRVRWVDNPDDPSITPEDAQSVRDWMHTMDAIGTKYRLRPFKEPVQAPAAAQPMSRPPNCPFKAPSRAIAPHSLDLCYTLPPKPPLPLDSQQAAASCRNPVPDEPQSARDRVSPAQPGSRFLVTSEDDDDSDSDSWKSGDVDNCSYEELVALGYIHGGEDPSHDEF